MAPQRVISSSPIENWTTLCYMHVGFGSKGAPCVAISMYLHRFGGLTAGSDKNLPAFSPPVSSLFIFSSQPVNKQYCCSPAGTCAFGVVNTAAAWKVHCNRGRKTILPWRPASACFITLLAASGSCSQTESCLPPSLPLTPAPENRYKW